MTHRFGLGIVPDDVEDVKAWALEQELPSGCSFGPTDTIVIREGLTYADEKKEQRIRIRVAEIECGGCDGAT